MRLCEIGDQIIGGRKIKTMDLVRLNDVVVFAKHGATAAEREYEQEFRINVELEADLSAASDNDTLSDTINYSLVHEVVTKVVKTTSYQLLERLGKHVLDELFQDTRIAKGSIGIAKARPLKRYNPEV